MSGISVSTTNEIVNALIDSIDVERINVRYLINESGLSKTSIKEVLCEVVDRCDAGLVKPSIRQEVYENSTVKNELVEKYGLTYSIAGRIVFLYNIDNVEQLKYLTDEELLNITGIGPNTLARIRKSFPYEKITALSESNVMINTLWLPTKIEEALRENGISTIKQLSSFIKNGLTDLGYPKCLIVQRAYELYKDGITDEISYQIDYLDIFLQSYSRNLNNIIRHSDDRLNLYWINQSIYHYVTYIYEIMTKGSNNKKLILDIWPDLECSRDITLSCMCKELFDSNEDAVKHYRRYFDLFMNVNKALYNDVD